MNKFIYISLANILLSMVVAIKLIGCEADNPSTLNMPSTELAYIEECHVAVYADLHFHSPINTNNIMAQRSSTSRHALRRCSTHKLFGYTLGKSSKSDEALDTTSNLPATQRLPFAVKSCGALLVRLRKLRI